MPRCSLLWTALLSFGGLIPHCARAAQTPTPAPSQALPGTTHGAARTAAEKRLAAGGAVHATADRALYGKDGQLDLSGHVRLRQGEREIRANALQYDNRTGALSTRGGIQYTDPRIEVTGKGGSYSPRTGALFDSAHFALRGHIAHGTARLMRVTPGGLLQMQGVSFTTCPQVRPSWVLRAKSITLHTRAHIGYGRDARIDLHGIPIVYLPWVSFPLGNVRKSGFLFPTLGNTSRGGLQISAPFYWNIAPNADLTVIPTEYQHRGVDLGGEARWLTRRQYTDLQWDYLPNDASYLGGRTRGRISLHTVMRLPHRVRLLLDGENVRDSAYFEDFATGPQGTSTAFLDRRAELSYRTVHWNIRGLAQQFQTIDSSLPLNERPYARLPDLTAAADYGWGPGELLRYGFKSELVDFQRSDHSTAVSGWRLDAMPRLSLNFGGPGYFIRPAIAWRFTQYELRHTALGQPAAPSRSLPIASFDTGLTLERTAGRNGQRLITIEPRVMYLYVPYRNQNNLPIFDTALPDLAPVELFRTNRYVGADRVGDANQVSAAVTTRLLGTATGRQYLSATLGEAFYFQTPRVTLPGETIQTDRRSDIIAELSLTAFKHWSARAAVQWNPQASRTQRAQVTLQYQPGPDRVINLGYRYERDSFEQASANALLCSTTPAVAAGSSCGIQQAEISAAWPIGRHWSLFARGIYSLQDHEALERFVGFEYRACCWSVRLGARRYVAVRPALQPVGVAQRTGAQDTGIYLQVELTGLASVGSAPDAFLSEAIPGYTPAAMASPATHP